MKYQLFFILIVLLFCEIEAKFVVTKLSYPSDSQITGTFADKSQILNCGDGKSEILPKDFSIRFRDVLDWDSQRDAITGFFAFSPTIGVSLKHNNYSLARVNDWQTVRNLDLSNDVEFEIEVSQPGTSDKRNSVSGSFQPHGFGGISDQKTEDRDVLIKYKDDTRSVPATTIDCVLLFSQESPKPSDKIDQWNTRATQFLSSRTTNVWHVYDAEQKNLDFTTDFSQPLTGTKTVVGPVTSRIENQIVSMVRTFNAKACSTVKLRIVGSAMALVYVNGFLLICAHDNQNNKCDWHTRSAFLDNDFVDADFPLDTTVYVPPFALNPSGQQLLAVSFFPDAASDYFQPVDVHETVDESSCVVKKEIKHFINFDTKWFTISEHNIRGKSTIVPQFNNITLFTEWRQIVSGQQAAPLHSKKFGNDRATIQGVSLALRYPDCGSVMLTVHYIGPFVLYHNQNPLICSDMVCRSNLPIEYSSWGDWKETSTRIAPGRDKVFQLNLTAEVNDFAVLTSGIHLHSIDVQLSTENQLQCSGTCIDGILNGLEEQIDCGGNCAACTTTTTTITTTTTTTTTSSTSLTSPSNNQSPGSTNDKTNDVSSNNANNNNTTLLNNTNNNKSSTTTISRVELSAVPTAMIDDNNNANGNEPADFPWLYIVIAAVACCVLAILAVIIVMAMRKKSTSDDTSLEAMSTADQYLSQVDNDFDNDDLDVPMSSPRHDTPVIYDELPPTTTQNLYNTVEPPAASNVYEDVDVPLT